MAPESISKQLRRRREAANRLPPLPCGHRDPLDCRHTSAETEAARKTWRHLKDHGLLDNAGWLEGVIREGR